MIDTAAVLTICVAIAAFGKLADQILLKRHVRALDGLALRYWNFLDDLDVRRIPLRAIRGFLRLFRWALGASFGPRYVLRLILISCALTLVAIPGGRILGLLATGYCNHLTGYTTGVITFEEALRAVWGNRVNINFPALVALNILFDFVTVLITTYLLRYSIRRSRLVIFAAVLLDLMICTALLIGLAYLSDGFDVMSTLFPSGFPSFTHNFTVLSYASCANFHLYTSRILFASTVLIPTLMYLALMLVLLVALEGFRLSRAVGLYVLEKSVEDEKRSIIGHIATAIALAVAAGELISVLWSFA